MFGLHAEFGRHLVAIISFEIGIKQLVVAGYGTADAGSMGSKDSCHLRQRLFQEKHAKAAHPFMGLINNLVRRGKTLTDDSLGKTACRHRKHRCLIIVTIRTQRIDMEILPGLGVNLIFIGIQRRKINQYGYRIPWNHPTTYANGKTGTGGSLLPLWQQEGVLFERSRIIPQIRT